MAISDMTNLQKQKIDAYAYLVSIGKYYVYEQDADMTSQLEVPDAYKESVAEKLLDES